MDKLPCAAVGDQLRRPVEKPAKSSICKHFEASKVEVHAKGGYLTTENKQNRKVVFAHLKASIRQHVWCAGFSHVSCRYFRGNQ